MSSFIINNLIRFEKIPSEDEEIYRYGTEQGLFSILNIITSLLIGLAFNMLWQAILFLGSYIMVRKYAGGFHSNTQAKCYLLSSAFIAIALYLNVILAQKTILSISILFIAFIIIWIMSPVEDLNKPLDEKEKQVYAQKARRRLLVNLVVAIVAGFATIYEVLDIISLSMLILALMLVIGKAKNYYVNKKLRDL